MSVIDELRENLRAAAQRDIEARARKRRRRRRTLGLLATVLVGGAAAAGAAELISVGEPVKNRVTQGKSYQRPAGNRVQILLRADSGLELPYGLGVYKAANGQQCVQVGFLRGGVELGELRGGAFRPYAREHGAACAKPGRELLDYTQAGPNYLVFGVAPSGVRRVAVTGKSAPTGPRGAFLLVFAGRAPTNLPPARYLR
jgi:hypothetical protein